MRGPEALGGFPPEMISWRTPCYPRNFYRLARLTNTHLCMASTLMKLARCQTWRGDTFRHPRGCITEIPSFIFLRTQASLKSQDTSTVYNITFRTSNICYHHPRIWRENTTGSIHHPKRALYPPICSLGWSELITFGTE